jgi:hypothetical protein
VKELKGIKADVAGLQHYEERADRAGRFACPFFFQLNDALAAIKEKLA